MNTLFTLLPDLLWDGVTGAAERNYRVIREQDRTTLEIPVPGLTREDLKITTDDRDILVTIKKEGYTWGSSKYRFRLQGLQTTGITARVRDGLLTIRIPDHKKYEKEVKIL